MFGLKTESSFDAAHFLSDYDGKCKNIHGHCWRVIAYLKTPSLKGEGQERGMIVDFGDFKTALRGLTEEFDHTLVVEEGSMNPATLECLANDGFALTMVPFRTTAENFAQYFAEKLVAQNLPVAMVEVYETDINCACYVVEG